MAETKPPRRVSDNLCKALAEQYPEEFVEWLFGVRPTALQVVKTELHREPIRADAALLAETGDVLYHIEFQTKAHSETPLPLRMLDYYVGFKRNFPTHSVRQTLVILKDSGLEVPAQYQDGTAFLRYNVVKLWETAPQELLAHAGLLPLAVLCRTDGPPAELLKKVAESIESLPTIAERREKTAWARVLAGLRFPQNAITKIFLEAEMLEESVIYQDILQRGVKRGLEQGLRQGLQQGEQLGEQKMVLQLINYRFGDLSAQLEKRLLQLPVARLEELGRQLFEMRDLDDLRKWLRKRAR